MTTVKTLLFPAGAEGNLYMIVTDKHWRMVGDR